MGDLTENFSRWEFACRCGCGKDDINLCLVHRLQVIRDINNLPIAISSGCRCLEHNKNEGGASVSYHIISEAADWYFDVPYSDSINFQVCMQLANWSGGFHYYKDKKIFHTDIGRMRRW